MGKSRQILNSLSYIERRDFAAFFEENRERAIWCLWSFVDEISLASVVDAVEEIDAKRQGRSVGASIVALLTSDAAVKGMMFLSTLHNIRNQIQTWQKGGEINNVHMEVKLNHGQMSWPFCPSETTLSF